MTDNVSYFERFTNEKPNNRAAWKTSHGKPIYQAAELESNGLAAHRLRCDYADGQVQMLLYGNLMSVYYTPVDGTISLWFTSGVIYLQGDELQALLDDLHNERIHTLREYTDSHFVLPRQEKEPGVIIRRMSFHTGESTGEEV